MRECAPDRVPAARVHFRRGIARRAPCRVHKPGVSFGAGPEMQSGRSPQPQGSKHDTRSPRCDDGWFWFPARFTSPGRSDPVNSVSTNCDTFGRNLPASLADGWLPGERSARCGLRSIAGTNWRPTFLNGMRAEPKVVRTPPRPANIPSLECRCRGNGIGERGTCGASASI